MRILLDECVPKSFGRRLTGHTYSTVAQCGWGGIVNGKLLRLAQERFDAFVTVDQNLTFQQNFQGISLTVIVMQAVSNALEDLEPFIPRLTEVLARPLSRGAVILGR